MTVALFAAYGQETLYKFDLGGGLGMSGYIGDANGQLFRHPGFASEAGMRYLANSRWAFRGTLGVTTLSGNSADMANALPDGAAYKFTATVVDISAKAEFNFFAYGVGETYKRLRRWSPYLTVGIGACVSMAEGNTAFASTLPMGVGVKYKVTPRLNLAVEFTMTKTFSDKIDGPDLNTLSGITKSFVKDTDWYGRLMVGLTYEFGERCATCHYVE